MLSTPMDNMHQNVDMYVPKQENIIDHELVLLFERKGQRRIFEACSNFIVELIQEYGHTILSDNRIGRDVN